MYNFLSLQVRLMGLPNVRDSKEKCLDSSCIPRMSNRLFAALLYQLVSIRSYIVSTVLYSLAT